VPLLLRPLRLVLLAETLRSLRIVLLKATHWPFVALILGWESGRLYLNRRLNAKPSTSPLRGPNSAKSSRHSLAGALLKPGLSKARSQPLDRETRTGRKPMSRPDPPAALDTDDDLAAAVTALQTQLESIASMIAERKDRKSASG